MKHLTIKHYFLFWALSIAFAACKVEEDPTPEPEVPAQTSPLPSYALLKSLKHSDIDFQQFNYDASGHLSQLVSQWQFVQNDPSQVRKVVYDFKLDAQNRPIELSIQSGFRTQYVYKNGLIEQTQEFFPGGAVYKDQSYQYRQGRISSIREVRANVSPAEGTTTFRFDYSYDQRGNLNKVQEYLLSNPDTPQEKAKLLMTTEYLDFDDHINPNSWLMVYPYLPHLRWQINNPRKELRYEGDFHKTTIFTYQYNAQKLPVLRRAQAEGPSLTVEYLYR
jgi:hypothetical protein